MPLYRQLNRILSLICLFALAFLLIHPLQRTSANADLVYFSVLPGKSTGATSWEMASKYGNVVSISEYMDQGIRIGFFYPNRQVITVTSTSTATITVTGTTTVTPTLTLTPATPTTTSLTQETAYPGLATATLSQTGIATQNPSLFASSTPLAPGFPSPTADLFALQAPASPLTATATLAPLPTIQLIFPTSLAQAPGVADPVQSAEIVYDAEGELIQPAEESSRPPTSRLLLILLVVLLWLGLGGWFVYLFRHVA